MANKKNKKKKPTKQTKHVVKKKYTEEEKARLANYHKRSEWKPVKFKNIDSDSGEPTIALKDPDDPLCEVKMLEALGTPDSALQSHLLDQVIQTFKGTVSTDGADNDKVVQACNNALSVLNGIQPQDEVEGLLAVQMIGVHNVAMQAMNRAMLGGQTSHGKQANIDQATKMLRTFIAQIEVLKKYRAKGQQKMMVGQVNVNEGGRAIVGTVNQRRITTKSL